MLRIALIDLLMFALPFLIYGAYMLLVKGIDPAESWQSAPILWLLAVGCGLVAIAMASLISFSGSKPGGVYHPPSIVDGVIKPSRIE